MIDIISGQGGIANVCAARHRDLRHQPHASIPKSPKSRILSPRKRKTPAPTAHAGLRARTLHYDTKIYITSTLTSKVNTASQELLRIELLDPAYTLYIPNVRAHMPLCKGTKRVLALIDPRKPSIHGDKPHSLKVAKYLPTQRVQVFNDSVLGLGTSNF